MERCKHHLLSDGHATCQPRFFTVIEGEANGADLLSRGAAEQLHLPVEPYAANWEKYGKAAGVIRNSEQLKAGACGVVAFHAHLANSKGTKDMVDKALKAGLPVWTYEMGLDRLMPFIIELTARMS